VTDERTDTQTDRQTDTECRHRRAYASHRAAKTTTLWETVRKAGAYRSGQPLLRLDTAFIKTDRKQDERKKIEDRRYNATNVYETVHISIPTYIRIAPSHYLSQNNNTMRVIN